MNLEMSFIYKSLCEFGWEPRRFFSVLAGALLILTGLCLAGESHAASKFDRWVNGFWPKARAAGISRTVYRRAFAGVTPDQAIIKLARRQPEFHKPVWDYLDSAVSEKRLKNGREKLQEWKSWLDRIEARYGVDRHIVVAIWGMESSYGYILENKKIVRSVIRSLATLAYAGGRRASYGRKQLIAALKILQNGDVTPARMLGSWAGAMGHTQFIPTTYAHYAVDANGDGRRDIWGTIPDALASTANYLNKARWRSGETWGYEVRLPAGFDYRLADTKTKRTLGQWQTLGVKRARGGGFPRRGDKAWLWMPAGASGPAFLMLPNFRSIKRYNNANSYALAVGHLADRLRGGSGFAADWPRSNPSLSSRHRRELQTLLNRHGYGAGPVDGKLGAKSRAAIRAYQRRANMVPDGYAGMALLRHIRRDR